MNWRSLIAPGLASIAYAFSLDYAGGTDNLQLTIASLLLLGAAAGKLTSGIRGGRLVMGVPIALMGAYLLLLVLLTYTSTLTENSVHFAWLFASFVFVAFLLSDVSAEVWRKAFFGFALTGAVSAGWGIAQWWVTMSRASGPIIDPSTWGAIMNLFFFGTLATYLTTPRHRLIGAAGVALFAVAVFTAYSRVGNVVFSAAFLFVIIVCAFQRRLWPRLGIALALVLVAWLGVNARANLAEASHHDEGYTLDVHQYGWSQRFDMWRSGLDIYSDYPLLGSGPGTFKVHYPAHRSLDEQNNFGNFVHNDYIQFLAEGGPLLLGFLVLFTSLLAVTVVRDTWRVVRGRDVDLEPLLLSVAMGVVLVQAIMNFPLYQFQVQMLLGLLFARFVVVSRLVSVRPLALARPRLGGALVVAAAVIVAIVPILDEISMEVVYNIDDLPVLREVSADSEDYLQVMSVLSAIRPQNSTNRLAMATIYRTSFDENRGAEGADSLAVAAALEYQAGLRSNPWHIRATQFLAEFLEQNPWLMEVQGVDTSPEVLYRRSAALYPSYIETWMALAFYLERQGRADEAYRLLVDEALPWINLRHGQYFDERLRFARAVLHRARAREDRDTLAALHDLLGRG
ncbi:MAG: O-antigen ligase family protein [Pseudomonadales bacterium]|nr:O-antigen ligase family protein [Pseudomonadales bacterium]